MAPLIRRIPQVPGLSIEVCSTGQHRHMIAQVFDLFGIRPDFELNVMEPDQSLSSLTSRLMSGLEPVLGKSKPDRVLVHVETATTMTASHSAYNQKIPVEHVEAGLRTGNIYAPWPEEINRHIADRIAEKLYAPTNGARDNLLREDIPASKIFVTGNTVIDALLDLVNGPLSEAGTIAELEKRFPFVGSSKKTILVTCHRRESYGAGFANVCAALLALSKRDDVEIVFPVHLNPNIRSAFATLNGCPNIHLIEPLNYLEFAFVMQRCFLVVTDSGGIQEEAPALGKPVLVLRTVTERPEAVEAGTVKLAGTDTRLILELAEKLLDDRNAYQAMSKSQNPYGDGKACQRIIASLRNEAFGAFHV
jgi:UDP-N-acetylglucosamine 2-epimerase (non-hydrolysing)